ncbi:MAG: hypothetical protein KJ709_08715 [Nanoarchaeota archaeon]|nr:hypothetical protein [Nanoarchaeota archaeon]
MAIQGKSKTLEYVHRELPHIPIPEFERVTVDLNWRWGLKDIFGFQKSKLAKKVGYPLIVRSDSKHEDGLGRSFAGIFNSDVVNSPSELERAIRKCRDEYDQDTAATYSEVRNIKAPTGPIDLMFMRYQKPSVLCVITRHPHQEDAHYVDFEVNIGTRFPNRYGFIFYENSDIIRTIEHFFTKTGDSRLIEYVYRKGFFFQFAEALGHYKEVERLKEFDDDKVAYQMESTLLPYSFVQWRPFRRKEKANFRVEDIAPPVDGERVLLAPTVFSITSEQGIQALHFPNDSYGLSKPDRKTYHWEREISQLWDDAEPLRQTGIPIAFSFYEISRYGNPLDKKSVVLPDVSFFHYDLTLYDDQNRPITTSAWQVHDAFRFLERESLVGLVGDAPFVEHYCQFIKYWSDGIKRVVEFIK